MNCMRGGRGLSLLNLSQAVSEAPKSSETLGFSKDQKTFQSYSLGFHYMKPEDFPVTLSGVSVHFQFSIGCFPAWRNNIP